MSLDTIQIIQPHTGPKVVIEYIFIALSEDFYHYF